ncbi:MAG TPA: hypothetical protein VMV31_14235 [Terriglobales bacterium]|nr:hypothetical protein [Terriglobales bacterium]
MGVMAEELGAWELAAQLRESQAAHGEAPKALHGAEPPPPPAAEAAIDEQPGEKRAQAAELLEIAGEAELFRTPDGVAMATFSVGAHAENHSIGSGKFKRWLAYRFYKKQGKPPVTQAATDVVAVLRAKAEYEGGQHDCHLRVAERGGSIFVDLGAADWGAVEIDKCGWRFIANAPPVKFHRPGGAMMPLPAPARGGDLSELRGFLNLESDADWALLAAWLLAAMRPKSSCPALVLTGEHGAAKTTAAKVLRALLDPTAAEPGGDPKDARDLAISAEHNRVMVLDNLSAIPQWLSDALCRLVTGGGFSTRLLFTDDEERIFRARRPVVLTSINDVVSRPDLLSRALIVALPVIPDAKRLSEEEFWASFEAARPRLLGALFDAVATALRRFPGVTLPRLPRMADFAKWAVAAEPSFGLGAGVTFSDAYDGNRSDANEMALEASAVAAAVQSWLPPCGWKGTSGELLAELAKHVGDGAAKQRGWPKTARAVAGELRRAAPNLRAAGVCLTILPRSHGGRRQMVLAREVPKQPSPPSPPSPPPQNRASSGDGQGDGCPPPVRQSAPETPRKRWAGDGGDGGDGRVPYSAGPAQGGLFGGEL